MASFWKLFVAVFAVALVCVGTPGAAVTAGPEDEALEIARALECPVCSGQSVADSPAPLAQGMRALIRKKLADGESREQIMQYFVDRYGESILREPPRSGLNQILWWLPFLVLVAGIGVLALAIKRWITRPPAQASSRASKVPADLAKYEARLEEELRRK
ncbi:MAG: cytochrome c-type biogenesis protein CcmH [Chloroflexi bacterium]|nr:cytochrome c-type biogenesis protein CcmH [Chloroflexota bacterium]